MKSTVLVFLGIATGMSLAYAEPSKTFELEPPANGAVSSPGFFASQQYASALLRGADHACNLPERATQRFANMLQASCVAADMSLGMDQSEIFRHCFSTERRGTFARSAEVVCGNSKT